VEDFGRDFFHFIDILCRWKIKDMWYFICGVDAVPLTLLMMYWCAEEIIFRVNIFWLRRAFHFHFSWFFWCRWGCDFFAVVALIFFFHYFSRWFFDWWLLSFSSLCRKIFSDFGRAFFSMAERLFHFLFRFAFALFSFFHYFRSWLFFIDKHFRLLLLWLRCRLAL